MAPAVGDQIAERYQLRSRIAVGGMGEVWEAEDERLGRTVAIKVLKSELGSDPEFLERFRGEARIAASLNHRGIAGVHDYGEDTTPDGTPTAYLVMELVRGEPLSTLLATRGKPGTELTLDVLEQAGRALQAAHTHGFVHRDVKPGNILLGEDGTVKLTDFGIAKAASAAPVTASGMVMGTAHYIAPEQAKGMEAEPASDVYALAVVGYECLAGHRPFSDEQPVNVAMMHINDPVPPLPDDVPENIRRLIEMTLVKDPRQRYANGGEFAAAVAAVRRGYPPPLPRSVSGESTGSGGTSAGATVTGRSPVSSTSSNGVGVAGLATPGGQPLPEKRPSAERSRQLAAPVRDGRSVMTIMFVVLTVAAVAIGVLVVRKAVDAGGAIPNVPPPTDSVQVDLASFAGRPVASVQSELENSGLRPVARTVQGEPPSAPASCAVTEVNPVGVIPRGTTVTITCEQR